MKKDKGMPEMNILTLENITLSYGTRKLFNRTSFYLEEGEKVGIVGINGAGKSTLLKLIAGLEQADSGRFVMANNHVIKYLPQTPVFEENMTVLEAALKGAESSAPGVSNSKRASDEDQMSAARDTDEESRIAEAKSMLTRLGVYDFLQTCGALSGGQKKRLALVNVLLSPAEILVLDEPTNHLDSEMADWLEERLRNYRGAVVMVTHDRYFLDSVAERIVEVDKGSIYSYAANYSGFLELKMQREEMERSTAKKRANILRNELAWVRRGAQARSTKQKARLERFEQMSALKAPVEDGRVELSSVSSRLGRTTVELHNISKSYGERTLIHDFTYLFLRDDRIGFIGPNGCGKSTLMKILAGLEQPDGGGIVLGQTVKLGYYAQETDETIMNPAQKVIDYIRDVAEFVETPEGKVSAVKMLEKFLFEGEDVYGQLGKLSGGERRRLHLCRVLMQAPNVLILDEPTNDLDITTLQILEDYLDHFAGIVIVVSHDRYFLDRVVRRIFAFEENGTIAQYEGGYTDYALRKAQQQVSEEPVSEEPVSGRTPGTRDRNGNAGNGDEGAGKGGKVSEAGSSGKDWKAGQKKKLKFTYQEQKEYESIEGEIAGLEARIEQLEAKILDNARDFVKLGELTDEKNEAEKQLEQKMNRWMELEELAARIAAGEMVESD